MIVFRTVSTPLVAQSMSTHCTHRKINTWKHLSVVSMEDRIIVSRLPDSGRTARCTQTNIQYTSFLISSMRDPKAFIGLINYNIQVLIASSAAEWVCV